MQTWCCSVFVLHMRTLVFIPWSPEEQSYLRKLAMLRFVLMKWRSPWPQYHNRSFLKIFLFYMYMTVLLAYMAIYHFCAWCLCRPGKNIRSLRTGLTEDHVAIGNWAKIIWKKPEHLPTEPPTEIFMTTLIKE